MPRQTLRDRNQHVIGYIDEEFSGRSCLHDSGNHVLGYYEPHSNETVDSCYHVIGRGISPYHSPGVFLNKLLFKKSAKS